jgi:t-SNARE complex subunit (syntaxin)
MKAINRMFRDVQEVVYVQGEVVDRIDYNIANADRNVVSANKELDQVATSFTPRSSNGIEVLLSSSRLASS